MSNVFNFLGSPLFYLTLAVLAVIIVVYLLRRRGWTISEFEWGIPPKLKIKPPAKASEPVGPSQTVTGSGKAALVDIDQKMAGTTPGMKQSVAGEGQAEISGVTQNIKAAIPSAEQAVQAKDNARIENTKQEM